MKRPVYCFIDDSPFEIALFEDLFPKEEPGIQFLCASNFDECKSILKERFIYPSLFILDLYGKDQANMDVSIPTKMELESKTREFINLEAVYQDLESFPGDLKVNEFLKRLFSIVNDWRELFTDVCQTVGQGRQFGIGNLHKVMNDFPMAGVVFYTRKALFPDALALNRLGCFEIFNKPMGRNNDEIRTKTKEQLNDLITQWNEVVRKKYIKLLEELSIKTEAENIRQTAKNSDLITLLNILRYSNIELEADLKFEAKRFINTRTSIFSGIPDIPEAFINGFKTWSTFYYSINSNNN